MEPNTHQPADFEQLTNRQAAQYLGVSPRTITRYSETGKLPYRILKRNGRRVFLGKDVKKLIQTY